MLILQDPSVPALPQTRKKAAVQLMERNPPSRRQSIAPLAVLLHTKGGWQTQPQLPIQKCGSFQKGSENVESEAED